MPRKYGESRDGQQQSRDGQSNAGNKKSQIPDYYQMNNAPSSREVAFLHKNSDVDSRDEAQHHTLGHGSAQASPGDHNHRDGKSMPILEGVSITGVTSGTNSVVIRSIIAALVELGATDSST